MRRVGLVAAVFVALVAAGLLVVRDAPPPDLADLRPSPPALADKDNGFRDLERLARLMPSAAEDLAVVGDGKALTPSHADVLLAKNAAALEIFRALARRPGFQDPALRDLDALVPGYLEKVPDDPFDGAPVRWSDGALRSAGPDHDGQRILVAL